MVGAASGLEVTCADLGRGAVEEGGHLRALKQNARGCSQDEGPSFSQASASRAGSAGAFVPNPGCAPCPFPRVLKLTPFS